MCFPPIWMLAGKGGDSQGRRGTTYLCSFTSPAAQKWSSLSPLGGALPKAIQFSSMPSAQEDLSQKCFLVLGGDHGGKAGSSAKPSHPLFLYIRFWQSNSMCCSSRAGRCPFTCGAVARAQILCASRQPLNVTTHTVRLHGYVALDSCARRMYSCVRGIEGRRRTPGSRHLNAEFPGH